MKQVAITGALSKLCRTAIRHFKPCRLPLLTLLNGCCLLLLWSVEYFVAERYWLTTLLTYCPQHLFVLPTVCLLVWGLWRRVWRMVALNFVIGVCCASYFLGYNTHLPWGTAERGTELRVMTYNINGGSHGAKAIAQAVLVEHPAILCLQESKGYTPFTDPVPRLQACLPGWYIARGAEVATFSRYPIIRQRLYKMPSPSGRVLLAITVAVQGQPVTIFNLHLSNAAFSLHHPRHSTKLASQTLWGRSTALRWAQVAVLTQATAQTHEPFIVMGDFNTPPRGLLYRHLSQHYRDAFHVAGWGMGYTFRTDLPVLRIDYVFTAQRIGVKDAFAHPATASDHRPLVADLIIPQLERP